MDEAKALHILAALADGINPLTGEVFPPDSPYQAADIVRSLFVAKAALDVRSRARQRNATPNNAGKPWTAEQDRQLLAGFDAGRSIAELAQSHERTAAGIQARLEKHGKLAPSPHALPSSRRRQG